MADIAADIAWMERKAAEARERNLISNNMYQWPGVCAFCETVPPRWESYILGTAVHEYCNTCGNLLFGGITCVIMSDDTPWAWRPWPGKGRGILG